MPGGDRTGPMGMGSLTGRGLGPCGRGLAFRKGFRRFGARDYTEPINLSKTEEKKVLELEVTELEVELKSLKQKLKELS